MNRGCSTSCHRPEMRHWACVSMTIILFMSSGSTDPLNITNGKQNPRYKMLWQPFRHRFVGLLQRITSQARLQISTSRQPHIDFDADTGNNTSKFDRLPYFIWLYQGSQLQRLINTSSRTNVNHLFISITTRLITIPWLLPNCMIASGRYSPAR